LRSGRRRTLEELTVTATPDLVLQAYDPRQATDHEYAALHAFFEQIDREERPLDPPVTLAYFIAQRRHGPAFFHPLGFAVWDGDVVVAEAGVWTIETGDNAHMAEFSVWVLPAYRRRGLARRLLRCVTQAAGERNRRLLLGRTASTIPAGEALMQRLGAKPGLPVHINQLALAELDMGLLRSWIEHSQQRASGFDVGWWEGPYPEGELEAIAGLWKVMNQAPRGELDMEDFNFTAAQLREMDVAMQARGTVRWSLYSRERVTGALAGYTEVFWNPQRPEFVFQGNTGVFPAYRNRGLGRWLKAAMLERVLRDRPRVRWVRTDNADINAPMLKINNELGFKPYLAETFWQVETEQVQAYLRASETAAQGMTG
jgi:GNAT superfamily N-acetyltransferase